MIPMAIGRPPAREPECLGARGDRRAPVREHPTTLLVRPYLAMLRKRNDGVADGGIFEDLPND